MAHQRTVIRNALTAMLSGATNADTNVYANRATNISNLKLPAIFISDENEVATPTDIGQSRFLRDVTTKIEIQVEANTLADSAVDDIALQVETAIAANRSISGTATTSIYTSTDLTFDGTGEKVIGKATLTYIIKYLS